MPRTGHPATRHVAAVERAVNVLDALAAADADLGTNEVARRTGIYASSVSRLLATLANAGLVSHVQETGRYRLGLRLLQLGNAALARVDLRAVVRPHLERLVAATGETATLSVPGEREATTIDFVQSAASVQSVARLGRPSIAHATAVGKLVLAHRGQLPSEPLEAFTQRTIIDTASLGREVARTAARGWAEAVGEREADLNAVAVPLCRGTELIAVLGLQGPAARFNRRAMRAAVEQLRASADEITAALAATPL